MLYTFQSDTNNPQIAIEILYKYVVLFIIDIIRRIQYFYFILSLYHLIYTFIAQWEAWSSWSSCSLTCGGGVKTRDRKCNVTVFDGNVSACDGDAQSSTICHDFLCQPGLIIQYLLKDWYYLQIVLST